MTHHLRKLNATIENIDIFMQKPLVVNDHVLPYGAATLMTIMSKSIRSMDMKLYTYLITIKMPRFIKITNILGICLMVVWSSITMSMSPCRMERLPDKINSLRPFSPVNTFSIRQMVYHKYESDS